MGLGVGPGKLDIPEQYKDSPQIFVEGGGMTTKPLGVMSKRQGNKALGTSA